MKVRWSKFYIIKDYTNYSFLRKQNLVKIKGRPVLDTQRLCEQVSSLYKRKILISTTTQKMGKTTLMDFNRSPIKAPSCYTTFCAKINKQIPVEHYASVVYVEKTTTPTFELVECKDYHVDKYESISEDVALKNENLKFIADVISEKSPCYFVKEGYSTCLSDETCEELLELIQNINSQE